MNSVPVSHAHLFDFSETHVCYYSLSCRSFIRFIYYYNYDNDNYDNYYHFNHFSYNVHTILFPLLPFLLIGEQDTIPTHDSSAIMATFFPEVYKWKPVTLKVLNNNDVSR